jgi:hypothetical protein
MLLFNSIRIPDGYRQLEVNEGINPHDQYNIGPDSWQDVQGTGLQGHLYLAQHKASGFVIIRKLPINSGTDPAI